MNTHRDVRFAKQRQRGFHRVARAPLMAGTIAAGMAFFIVTLQAPPSAAAPPIAPVYNHATTSSPIALSADNNLVWAVNAGADSVSVIDAHSYAEVAEIPTGDEPQAVALSPDNKYAYVANAAAGSVTIINITNADPAAFAAAPAGHALATGAEPYNIVISPNGQRVFVANSGQDTITVIDAINQHIIGHVDLRHSLCNDPDRNRRFQPRGLAVTQDNTKLYVTRFLSFTKPGGQQGKDDGKEGLVCRLDINTASLHIGDYHPASAVRLAAQVTGFQVDRDGDETLDDTSAFPNQLQSIVVRGDQAYLPNVAASPDGPQLFNVSTQAFVNRVAGVNGDHQTDAGALNLNLGARQPEPGKTILFFSNQWGIAFTSQQGAGNAYAVSAGSDLLVKLNVDTGGNLSFTVDDDTTRYIDLNDPDNPATSGVNAGKNPLGIVINDAGNTAFVKNNVSGNVSVVDLAADAVVQAVATVDPQPPGSPQEVVAVGAEMFFSSRGNFDPIPGATISFRNRLSQAGWQACSSCHFEGINDGVIWAFGSGSHKSVPLNATFNPRNPDEQRILNYVAIFDEGVEDFEGNVRNTPGPGPLAEPVPCDDGASTSTFDPNHGLILGTDPNNPPCVVNAFIPPNADRPQVTVTLPGSDVAVPALTALSEWVRVAVRTPSGASNLAQADVDAGRDLFIQAGCQTCHGGDLWTSSVKNFVSPPAAADICTEVPNPDPAVDEALCGGDGPTPPLSFGNPVGAQYLTDFLRDIDSFALNVPGAGNGVPGQPQVGATEITSASGTLAPPQDALGIDYNDDGEGNGFSPPSMLAVGIVPPYYHNGACETLACVLADADHRAAGHGADVLAASQQQALVVKFLESIDAGTQPVN